MSCVEKFIYYPTVISNIGKYFKVMPRIFYILATWDLFNDDMKRRREEREGKGRKEQREGINNVN